MLGFAPAVFAPRKAGELRVIILQEGGENAAPLAVEFETPDYLALNMAEAAAAQALAAIRHSAEIADKYGLGGQEFTDERMPGLARLLTSVETAAHLWRDWNFAERDPESGEVTVLPLDRPNILRVLEDPQIRVVWTANLEAASPLGRDEGNASAASPSGTTAQAATTATDASSAPVPAALDGAAAPESSVQGSSTNP